MSTHRTTPTPHITAGVFRCLEVGLATGPGSGLPARWADQDSQDLATVALSSADRRADPFDLPDLPRALGPFESLAPALRPVARRSDHAREDRLARRATWAAM